MQLYKCFQKKNTDYQFYVYFTLVIVILTLKHICVMSKMRTLLVLVSVIPLDINEQIKFKMQQPYQEVLSVYPKADNLICIIYKYRYTNDLSASK